MRAETGLRLPDAIVLDTALSHRVRAVVTFDAGTDSCPLSLYLDLTGQLFDDRPDPDRDFALGWYKRHASSGAFLASVKARL